VNKQDDRRTAILERLADHVLAHGLNASSLRPLAKAAHTSDRMLLYYFKDKAELFQAILELVAQRMTRLLQARAPTKPLPLNALVAELQAIVFAPDLWPYMRVWLEMASLSAGSDPLYRHIGNRIGHGFLSWGTSLLDSPTPEADAAKLLVTIEGMVLLKAIGMDETCRNAL
jgi:AcrR family transcriptional regulator